MSLWLIDVAAASLFALVGGLAGYYLRGPRWATANRPRPQSTAEESLRDLHQVAETVQACIQEHTECIQAIEAELCETSANEPAVLSAAVSSIRNANQQVCNEFLHLREDLDNQAEAINYTLDHSRTLLLTTLSLDHQKHQYQKVLESLRQLAFEMNNDVAGCDNKLRKISEAMEGPVTQATEITGAITQILDATDTVRERMESAEEAIETQAAQVQMQAVLGHTDMLTSLPNRRALDEELRRMSLESQQTRQPFSMVVIDLDGFKQINANYGHNGGDLVLRGIANLLKNSLRGGDIVTRCGGEKFALLLSNTTLAQALPISERLRESIENAQYSYGSRALRVTASLGTSQFVRGEDPKETEHRSEAALSTAKQNGGNATWWHDGREAYPVHEVHLNRFPNSTSRTSDLPGPIATPTGHGAANSASQPAADDLDTGISVQQKGRYEVQMSGRSLFISNIKRRLDTWCEGGPPVSVILMRVDQHTELVERFGPQANDFLKRVVGKLLEATSRNMDERCNYDEQTFGLLLVGSDGVTAKRIAKRLRSQVGQSKLRFNEEIWELSATVGAAQCREGGTAMELLLDAEALLNEAASLGGNMLCMNDSA